MNIEFDVTLNCNFSCLNCNRHSNFNSLTNPYDSEKSAGLNYYGNTSVSLEAVDKLISDIKENKNVEKIHIIGGEPLTHPKIDVIVDKLRDELLGTYVPDIVIISNLHPKMLKAGTLDTPDRFVKFYRFDKHEQIKWGYAPQFLQNLLSSVKGYMSQENLDAEKFSEIMGSIAVSESSGGTLTVSDLLSGVKSFRGVLVSNFTPLDEKSDIHRCSLVSPYDSGQEMIPLCNIPKRCGTNYSFDGYWPCSQGAAIARLFNLKQFNRKDIPKSFEDWPGVDGKGNAVVNKKSPIWELCKHCQLAAKSKMLEKDHGRPISISYRKALGIEDGEKSPSEYVVAAHKKNLASSIYLEPNCETECKS